MLLKDESGTAKQIIKPSTWTWVSYEGKTKFAADKLGRNQWLSQIRIWFPKNNMPSTVRTRFVRFPDTAKADETGHVSHPVMPQWAGRAEHIHFSHDFESGPKMPVGVWIWHDGKSPIILDGRQVKANPLA